MTYIYLACSINVMVFMICTMGMWIYRMLWFTTEWACGFTTEWACGFSTEWACGFWTRVRSGRPKKTCPLCLEIRGTKKRQKTPLHEKNHFVIVMFFVIFSRSTSTNNNSSDLPFFSSVPAPASTVRC
jgi:hypothetical protein